MSIMSITPSSRNHYLSTNSIRDTSNDLNRVIQRVFLTYTGICPQEDPFDIPWEQIPFQALPNFPNFHRAILLCCTKNSIKSREKQRHFGRVTKEYYNTHAFIAMNQSAERCVSPDPKTTVSKRRYDQDISRWKKELYKRGEKPPISMEFLETKYWQQVIPKIEEARQFVAAMSLQKKDSNIVD